VSLSGRALHGSYSVALNGERRITVVCGNPNYTADRALARYGAMGGARFASGLTTVVRNGCNAGVYREIFATKTRMFQNDDIRDVFAEMKGRGYEVKAVRQILKIRKQDQAERQEQEAILDVYMQALGML
jgi:uncharacterized protein (UPF0335 family)